MTTDWRRAACFDRQLDIEILQALENDIRIQLQQPQDVGLLLRRLEDSFANLIQISPREVCLAEEPTREIETLRSMYLDEAQMEVLPVATRPKGERAVILTQIKDAFTRAGIWSLIRTQISAAKYTEKKGDPLVFDFGYEVGGEVRFFQAVPLKASITPAIALASRFPSIAKCISEKVSEQGRQNALLTAVVADDLDRKRPEIEFALETFRENHVQVATQAEMPSIAERARQDLRA